jgi:hypothetical protein
MIRMDIKVEGTAARIEALFRFDKAAWSAVQKGSKDAVREIVSDAQSRIPPMGLAPTSGGRGWGPWFSDGRDLSYSRSGFRFSTRFRSRNVKGFREVKAKR